MAGLCNPLSTLRRSPRGQLRMTRGRCDSLLLHRDGLAPSTPCRSPGALRFSPNWRRSGHRLRARTHDGDDVRLPKAVPGIDVVIGAHSHTELHEAIIVNDRTPVVQTGKYGENLGELVITLDGGKLTVESYQLHPIDDTIAGDRVIAEEITKFKKTVTSIVFASRGYSIDQPL